MISPPLLIFYLPSASLKHTPRVLAVNPAQPICAFPRQHWACRGCDQLSVPGEADLAALQASTGPSPEAVLQMEEPGALYSVRVFIIHNNLY